MSKDYSFTLSATDKTAAAFKSVGTNLKTIDGKLARTNKGMGNLGRGAGQAGIQIQQFVGQIQGGQNALLALSQQGADLGFVLGSPLIGAIIGIGASIVGFLAPSIIGATTNIEELITEIERLEDVQKRTSAQAAVLAQDRELNNESLSKENLAIAKQIKLLDEKLRKQTSAGTGTDDGEFAIPRSAEQNQKRYAASIKETEQELVNLKGQLDTNNQIIIENNEKITKLGEDTEEAAVKIASLTTSLQTEVIALEAGARAAEVYSAAQRLAGTENESQLPTIIDLINRKYDLRAAQEAAKLSAQEEARTLSELEREYQKFLTALERSTAIREQSEQRRGTILGGLQLEIQAYQVGANAIAEFNAQKALGVDATEQEIQSYVRLQEQLATLKDSYQSNGEALELINWESFGNRAAGALTSVSLGLTDGRDAARQLATSILTESLGALIQYGSKSLSVWAADALGFSAAQATKATAVTASNTVQATSGLAALGTVTAASMASGAAIASAMAPAAAATSIATAGAAPAAAAPIALGTIGAIVAALVGVAAASSFDGGGYTGNGARAGGLDGKGGRLAMLHPQETVIDHTKGQSSGGMTLNNNVTIQGNASESMVDQLRKENKRFARYVQSVVSAPL